MKIVKLGEKVMGYGVRGRILTFLRRNKHAAFTVKQIANNTNMSISQAQSMLLTLRDAGRVRAARIPVKRKHNRLVHYYAYEKVMTPKMLERELFWFDYHLGKVRDIYTNAIKRAIH